MYICLQEEGGSSQKGRKNIRKIMSKGDISKSTKQAEREEEERRKRVADRQKTVGYAGQSYLNVVVKLE